MRVQILFLFAVFAFGCGCDDGGANKEHVIGDDGATDDASNPLERHPWFAADGPGGPVILVPIALPRIGGLFVHTREMSNTEARNLGADIPADATGDLPVLVDYPTGAAIANAASVRDGLEPCYAVPVGDNPAPRPCNGWRVIHFAEWAELVDDAPPGADEWPGSSREPCAEALDVRDVCYRCTCPDGPAPVGASLPNRFGLQDMLGNEAEVVTGGGLVGGGWRDGWQIFRRGDPFEEPEPRSDGERGALRLVSSPPL